MTRRKKSKGSKSPLIRLVGLEVAVTVTGVAGAMSATAAPGDLDPSFGDVGRKSSFHSSTFDEWSVDVQADDAVLLGGGGEYCYWGCYEDYFVGRLLPNGTPDASFSAAVLADTLVLDTALQPDGKVIGVGYKGTTLQVFRLRPDGALDPDFGLGGTVLVGDGSNMVYQGHSVIVDPDGRIVVAGSVANTLLVARLLTNGTMDATFGTGGIYISSAAGGYGGYPARIARAPGGGYRVTAHGPQAPVAGGSSSSCNVFGLTDAGALDAGFGVAGIAAAPSTSLKGIGCRSLAMQGDGRILLGGSNNETVGGGYIGRLLATGAADSSFHPDQAAAKMTGVSALAVGSSGSIFVTGRDRTGFSGALVVRLLADGTLDPLFGRAGVATVDLNARRAVVPVVSDMKVTANDALVIAGNSYYSGGVFVARLLGNVADASPGVLGMRQHRVLGTEQGGQAVLSVHRSGGGQGAVAVRYVTRDFPPPTAPGSEYAPGERAINGADYTTSTGRLTWADGEFGDKEIVVPIASDTNAEKPEFFEVVLEAPEGGAGLGAFGADIEIAGASYPAGDLTMQAVSGNLAEGSSAVIQVTRSYYSQGVVSVTVRAAAGGSATPGQDFQTQGKSDWQDVVLTFGDGEMFKTFYVPTVRDSTNEPAETFRLELVSPTGGAMLGDATYATVTILDSPPPSGGGSNSGSGTRSGGGSLGWLGAMLLGLGGALRRRRIRNR